MSRYLPIICLLLMMQFVVPSVGHAAKSSAQIKADIARAKREHAARSAKIKQEHEKNEKATARAVEEANERDRKLKAEWDADPVMQEIRSRVDSPLEYKLRRGDQFAWRVVMATPDDHDQVRWVGDVYALVVYSSSDTSPAEVMVIGRAECSAKKGDRWVRRESDDIDFTDNIRFSSTGTPSSSRNDKEKLPLQMHLLLTPEALLFPRLPMYLTKEGDEHRGTASAMVLYNSGASGFKNVKFDTYGLVKIENAKSSRSTIINKTAYSDQKNGYGFVYSHQGTFDVKAGMPIDMDLTYIEKMHGDSRIDVATRSRTGSDLERIKQQALAMHPASEWPLTLKRVPVDAEDYEIGGPKSVAELGQGESVMVYRSVGNRQVRTYSAKVVKNLSADKALIRLDGTGEESEESLYAIHQRK